MNIFKQRRLLNIEKQNDEEFTTEWMTIVVAIGMFIVHEFAHLAMRWTLLPRQNTPAKFYREAGYFIECALFDGSVNVIVNLGNSEIWNDNTQVKCKFI